MCRHNSLKALFFDIDGTLLDSECNMSAATYDALKRCSEKGLLLAPVTARHRKVVFSVHNKIPGEIGFFTNKGVYYCGGLVTDETTGLYRHITIPSGVVRGITDLAELYDDSFQIMIQYGDDYQSFRHVLSEEVLLSWGIAPEELLPYERAKNLEATKINIFTEESFTLCSDKSARFYDALYKDFGQFANIIPPDAGACVQVVAKDATKGNGINIIIHKHGIRPEEVAVFGDDTSDIAMFGIFGYSIAMGNAREEVKKAATHVTLSNNDDGVAYALKEILHILP